MTRTLSVYRVTRPVRKPQITPENHHDYSTADNVIHNELTNNRSAQRNDQEIRTATDQMRHVDVLDANLTVHLAHVVQHNGHSIVEQRFAKDDNVQDFIDMDLLEDGQHRNGIDGRYQRGE